MSDGGLGRLKRVDLRDIWSSEASDFTPWLAQEKNLAVLGDALGLDLELEAQEKSVGPFRADILCKDVDSDAWVLVENQLDSTDHKHLGQLLTYASGLEAVTIIWIAAPFREEHRAALDWLNKITDERFRFFGLEVELWRIGDSLAAPRFNVVSKPNNWSRLVAQAARTIDEGGLSETKVMQREYWAAFHEVLCRFEGPIDASNRTPLAQPWMPYPIGRSRMRLGTVMIRPNKCVRAELYLETEHAKAFFYLLQKQQDDIEAELGFSLQWEELPDGQDSRIAVYLEDADPDDRKDWPHQHEWLAEKLGELHRVFAGRVKELDPDDWDGGE